MSSREILIIEPFYKGSHKYWVDSLKKYSSHKIEVDLKTGVFWKWRFFQSSYEFQIASDHNYEIILTTNMHNLSSWAAINRHHLKNAKLIHYFHENQLNYPGVSLEDQKIFGFQNVINAIAADEIVFNSIFHRDLFLNTIEVLNPKLKDKIPTKIIQSLYSKSHILGIGLDVDHFKQYQLEANNQKPLVLWNHRWESDKNPELFFETLKELSEKGLEFDLCVLGFAPKDMPEVFHLAKQQLKHHIIHWGAVQDFSEYAKWLWRADILPVTSHHDFFGISVLEAALCKTQLLLPKRNAYPEHFSPNEFASHYYDSDEQFKLSLEKFLKGQIPTMNFSDIAEQYAWSNIILEYDRFFNNL